MQIQIISAVAIMVKIVVQIRAMKFKNRRKILRLNSPAPPNGGSDDSDGHDLDYVPSSPV